MLQCHGIPDKRGRPNYKFTVNRSIISLPRATSSGELRSRSLGNRFNQRSPPPHGFNRVTCNWNISRFTPNLIPTNSVKWLRTLKIDSPLDTSQALRLADSLSTYGTFTSIPWRKSSCAISHLYQYQITDPADRYRWFLYPYIQISRYFLRRESSESRETRPNA